MAVKPVPDGFHTVTPYLAVADLTQLLTFVRKAFDATIIDSMKGPDGNVWHASFRIGDSMILAGQANEKWPAMPSTIHLYVPNADAMYRSALAAGATSVMEVTDQFYGDRSGGVKDSNGNFWWVSTHIEDVSSEEVQRRARASGK